MTLFKLEPPKLYSIAIMPSNEFNLGIKSLKRRIFEKIGSYPSCNSEGHITLNKFMATIESLYQWEKLLFTFCENKIPYEIYFNGTGVFPKGTFYLELDSKTKNTTIELMRDFHLASKQLKPNVKVTTPHLSIARTGLTSQQLEIAKELIEPIDLKFVCDSLCIRRFNEQRQQYDLYKRIQFAGS